MTDRTNINRDRDTLNQNSLSAAKQPWPNLTRDFNSNICGYPARLPSGYEPLQVSCASELYRRANSMRLKSSSSFRSSDESMRNHADLENYVEIPISPTADLSVGPTVNLADAKASFPIVLGSPDRTTEASSISHEEGLSTLSSEDHNPRLILQPESREISQEELATEVKSIYNGIAVLESKCRQVDQLQSNNIKAGLPCDLTPEHWQALIGFHQSLLHEYHDFLSASQHPSASPAIRRLAEKYFIPARLWRYGVHSFLEVLRYRLPESREYLLAFFGQAYHMLSLLYETIPTFESTWIECFGDTARYRMAIGDDVRDKEIWADRARDWYSKAVDKSPRVGRLYNHLAILSRPNILRRQYYYSRSFTSMQPFPDARKSIINVFDPAATLPPFEMIFVETVRVLFEQKSLDQFDRLAQECLNRSDDHISQADSRFKEQGVYMAVILISCFFEFGALRQAFPDATPESVSPSASTNSLPTEKKDGKTSVNGQLRSLDDLSTPTFNRVWYLTYQTLSLILHRFGDPNILPHVHVSLLFLLNLGRTECSRVGGHFLAQCIPWDAITDLLNSLSRIEESGPQIINSPSFPQPDKGDDRPLPEDYLVREQVWSQDYFPEGWFTKSSLDEEERTLELASTEKARAKRILWIGRMIASFGLWITYDDTSQTWSTLPVAVAGATHPAQLTPVHVKVDSPTTYIKTIAAVKSEVKEDDEWMIVSDD